MENGSVTETGSADDRLTPESESRVNGTKEGPPKWRSSRYTLVYTIMLGMFSIFFQRVTFSMVIVCMVNHTALSYNTDSAYRTSAESQWTSQRPTASKSNLSSSPLLNLSRATNAKLMWTQSLVINVSTDSGGDGHTNQSVDFISVKYDSGKERALGGNFSDWKDRVLSKGTMVEETPADSHACERQTDEQTPDSKEDGPFVWDKDLQGLLLGAVYWGYMSVQFLVSYLNHWFGPRHVACASVLAMSVFTMLCHPAALVSPWFVFALRVATGVCTGFAIPSMYGILGRWSPSHERAALMSLSFSGQNVANTVAFPVAALLCKYGFGGGWPSVFYVSGLTGVVWCILWMIFITDLPETSKRISVEERDYILAHRGLVYSKDDKIDVPWGKILTSLPVWAMVVSQVSFTWGLFLFMSNLPTYMYEVMNFDIKSNGVYSMLPYIALGCVQMCNGFIIDALIRRKVLGVFWARRLSCCIANLVPAVSVTILGFLDCSQVPAVITMLVIAVGFTGFAFSCFLVNPYDIAPRYAVSIISLSNSVACSTGIITPYFVAEVTKDKTQEQWQIVFFTTAAIYVLGTLFFCIFGHTKPLPWAVPRQTDIEIEVETLEPSEENKRQNSRVLNSEEASLESQEAQAFCEESVA